VLLGGVVYLNALRNPFVYDDHHTIVENGSIVDVANIPAIVLGALTRPVVNFSYALDRAIWIGPRERGASPFGFHVTNVLMHMLNVALLFQIARRFGLDEFSAFAGAALFAVHPMMTEAVGYISGRSEVLCAMFFILALMNGRRWLGRDTAKGCEQRINPWPLLTVGCWLAALASKESAAMFPVVFLVYDWLAVGRSTGDMRKRFLTVHLPLIGVAAIGGVVRLFVFARIEYTGRTGVHWNYVLLELDVIRRYLQMMIIPSGQTIFHEVAAVTLLSPRVWVAALLLTAMFALSWKLRKVDWVAAFGMLWFLLLLAPSSALIALDQGEPMSEHRVYLASCGLFLAAGSAFGWLRSSWTGFKGSTGVRPHTRWKGAPALILALVIIAFGGEAMARNAVWSDPVALWRESVDLAPAHYRPRLLLGEALQDAGRRDEAIEQYQAAIRLRPTEPIGYVKVGQCFAEVGQWAEARRQFLTAIEMDPQNRAAHDSLTVLNHVESRLGADGSRR
jgi:hypothetical protein